MDALLGRARHVIVLDHLAHATAAKAEVALPAATFAEAEGTLVNNEGRAQRFFKVLEPAAPSPGKLALAARHRPRVRLRGVYAVAEPGRRHGGHGARAALLRARSRALRRRPASASLGQKIPRQPHRYSGRTAMHADANVHEPQPPDDPDSPLAFSMEGYSGQPPPPLIPRFWAPGWNSVQAVDQVPGRGRRPASRRRSGPAPDRALRNPRQPLRRRAIPPAFVARAGEWLVVPLHHVFGSEELSVHSRGVAELAPKPYLALSPEDLQRLGAADGDEIELTLDGATLRLPAKRGRRWRAAWPGSRSGCRACPLSRCRRGPRSGAKRRRRKAGMDGPRLA